MGTLVFQATLGGAVNIIGPNIAGTVNFTLPSADGSSGQAVSTNGSGVLSFGTLAVTAGGTGVTTSTGSGNNVLSTSPTLVTPILGTPTSGNFSTGTFTWPTFNQNTSGTAAGLSATLAVASGGTGQTTYTDGQLLIGNSTGNTLTKATLTAGTNVTITNSAGAITIAATGGGGSSQWTTSGSNIYYNTGSVLAGTTITALTSGTAQFAAVNSNALTKIFVGSSSSFSSGNAGGQLSLGKLSGGTELREFAMIEGSPSDPTSGADGWMIFKVRSSEATTERMRLTQQGHLLVKTTTSTGFQDGFSLYQENNNSQLIIGHGNGAASGNTYVSFLYNGGGIGSITQNGTTGVLYNLTSDYRLKNNPQALSGAKNFVMALQPKKWQWWDGSGEGVGFIAHEFMEVAKYSGNGIKDAVDADGKPIHQSIQPSSSEVMANLVSFIQEQQTMIESLKADVTALKGTA
jgi:hypothetical protein